MLIQNLYQRSVTIALSIGSYMNKSGRRFQQNYLRLAASRSTWAFIGASINENGRRFQRNYLRLIASRSTWAFIGASINENGRRFQRNYLRLAASRSTWAFIGASMSAGIVLVIAVGYFIGAEWARESLRNQWQAKIDSQQRRLAEDSAAWNAELALLSRKIGLFEARLTRLDVLGAQLVESYSLDQGEFDFLSKPGIGGGNYGGADYSVDRLRMSSLINDLDANIKERELQLSILKDILSKEELAKGMEPLGWPVTKGWVSSKFGYRVSPFSGRREYHSGIDIAGTEGMPIYALASGVVKYARRFENYGNTIEINHGNGYSTRYAHNQANLVKEGQTVKQGDAIGLLGNTGRSTGAHLHFEVLKGNRQINPEKYLLSR